MGVLDFIKNTIFGWKIDAKTLLGFFAVLSFLAGFWYFFNWEPFSLGVKFAGISLGTVIILFGEKWINSYFKQPTDTASAQITPTHILVQFFLGLVLGGIVVVASSSTGFSMLLPPVQASVAGQAFTSIFIAPLIEEPFFRFAVPFLLYALFSKITGKRWLGATISLVLSAITFAVYHWLAYGATTLVTGAFIGAGMFGFLLLFIQLAKNNWVFSSRGAATIMVTCFMAHLIFNLFIYAKPFFIAGVTQ